MKTLKIILGVIALLVAAAQYALTAGWWNLSPGAIGAIGAVAAFLGALGVQVLQVPARVAQILGAGATLIATVVGIHAANISRAANPHPYIWATVAAIGVLAGAIGRLQLPPKPVTPPPVEPGP
jgi:hypothetical protein